MQLGCYLQSGARWYSFALQHSTCCAKPKLPAMELSSDCSWDWGMLYFQDSSYILTMILSGIDLSDLLWDPKGTVPLCNLLVWLCGRGYFGGSSGALDWGESVGVALFWSSLFGVGERWDFLPHLECRPGVGDQTGVSHVPPRPVVLQCSHNNAGWGFWAMLNSIVQAAPRSCGVGSFLPQDPTMVQDGHQMAWALWSTHAV